MKRSISQILSVVSLLWVLSMSAAFSQSSEVLVTIPFSFHVQQWTMPAGEYVLQLSSYPTARVLIRSVTGGNTVCVLTNPMKIGIKGGNSRLVFNQYGSDYFLSKILFAAENNSQEFIKGKLEKELEANNSKAAATEIAMKRH